MKIFLLIVIFIFSQFLSAYDALIHLHLKNINKIYKTVSSNKILNKIKTSKEWNDFLNSKLYLRLSEDINSFDPNHKILNFKNLSMLPEGSFDLYLTNIGNETFTIDLKLDKSQAYALLNTDVSKLEQIPFNDSNIYIKDSLYFYFKNNHFYLSNNLKEFKKFLNENKNYEKNLNKNFLYLNIKEIKKTPYLKTYWFTEKLNFENFNSVYIEFELTEKSFTEKGVINLDMKIGNKDLKIIEGNYGINIFNTDMNLKFPVLNEMKNIKIYNMVSNDLNKKLYLAYGNISDIEKFLKNKYPSMKNSKTDKYIKFRFGLLNKDVLYLKKIDDKNILFSNDEELINKVKLIKNKNLIKKTELKNPSIISAYIKTLSKNNIQNYSFENFRKGFLNNYFKIKYFIYQSYSENEKINFSTEIKF